MSTLFRGLGKLKGLQKLFLGLESVQGSGASVTVMLHTLKQWPELKELHVNFLKYVLLTSYRNDTDWADEMNLRNRL